MMLSGSCPVKTLARSHFDDRHDAHRHSGEAQRESRGVDGACYRAAIPFWIERAPLEGPMFIDCRAHFLPCQFSSRVSLQPPALDSAQRLSG